MFALAIPAFAEEVQHKPKHKPGQGIEKRIEHQEKRIQEGVRKGKLSQDQAAKLQQNLDAVKAQEQADLKDGKISKEQRQEMRKKLDENGKEIRTEFRQAGKPASPEASPAPSVNPGK